MIRRHLVITGKVQNVFYRDWMVEQAEGLGLDGWVRNRADGSVAVVQGAPEMVAAMIARAREGSPPSRVDDVMVGEAGPETLAGLVKRPTR
jgi:acylphosphatase